MPKHIEAKRHEVDIQPLDNALLFAQLPGFGLQSTLQNLRQRITLVGPIWRRKLWLDGVRRQVLIYGIPRQGPSAARSAEWRASAANASVG
jgi:hypothetical protein